MRFFHEAKKNINKNINKLLKIKKKPISNDFRSLYLTCLSSIILISFFSLLPSIANYTSKLIFNSKLITYVGYTNDLKKRLRMHNKGKGAKFTMVRHWKIVYTETHDTKNEAKSREYYIKKNRKFRNLIREKYK